MTDIRWQQRFEQFQRAFDLLQSAVSVDSPSVLERAGLVKFFEMAFELSWKLLKDFEETEGYNISSPREAIKKAFQVGLIEDGKRWLQALEDRNLTTQPYNETTAMEVDLKIRQEYFPLLAELNQAFKNRVCLCAIKLHLD